MSGQDCLPTGKHKPALMTAVGALIAFIGDQPLGDKLEARLNDRYGPTTDRFLEIQRLIRIGIEEGWAGYTQVDGPDYCRGRLANASPETRDFVLESARLRNVRGQYHRHPLGEINMIQPVDPDGKFCGHGAGWTVFAPDTSHYPTVTGGTVTFLFLLPKGLIEYKAAPSGAT